MKSKFFIPLVPLLFVAFMHTPLVAQEGATEAVLTLHTSLPQGSTFQMGLHSRKPFSIDWGNGELIPYEDGNHGVDGIKGEVKGEGWIRLFSDAPNDILSLYIGRDDLNQQVDQIDLSQLKGLKFLYCQNNRLEKLDISPCLRMMELNVAYNQLQELDLRNAPLLDMLVCQNNQLQELDLSPVQSLMALRCEYNKITSLDLRHFKKLTVVRCEGNPLKELDLSQNTALQQIFASDTQVKTWDLTPHEDLRVLDLSGVENPSITWGNKEELRQIFLNRCSLSTIEFPALPQIDRLEVEDNQLIALPLDGMPLLRDLRCGKNLLQQIDLKKVTHLDYLFAEGNQLCEIDLSHSQKIKELLLSYNKLTSIDLSSCPQLYLLWLSKNPIQELNITSTPKLFSLFLDDCQLMDKSIKDIVATLPNIQEIKPSERTAWWKTWLLLKGNPYTEIPDTASASKKGWKVDLTDLWQGRDNATELVEATDEVKVIRTGNRLAIYAVDELPAVISVRLYSLLGELVATVDTLEELKEIVLPNSAEYYLCVWKVEDKVYHSLL